MVKCVTGVLSLKGALDKYSLGKVEKMESRRMEICAGIERLLGTSPFDSEREAWGKTIYRLAQEYMRLGVMAVYQRVSPEIFSLTGPSIEKVWTGINREEAQLTEPLVLPLFVAASTNVEEIEVVDKRGLSSTTVQYSQSRMCDIKVSVKVPPLPEKMRCARREAETMTYQLRAEISSDPILGRVIDRARYGDLSDQVKLYDTEGLLTSPVFWTLWRPSQSDWKTEVKNIPPPDRDPALIMGYNNARFVVGVWDIPDEPPFRHILQEFGISDAK
ncbi:MAG TPA: hypothetical protein VJB87_03985 [Candidatus Nanoarchaeia archaeon]|nr:hypothetical protein [Candidatus Nanoarchaeia archaeon]